VESIGGDDTRSWRPPHAEPKGIDNIPLPDKPPESAYFLSVNRNKRAISIDFKKSKGLEILHELVKQSDLLVENFIPGEQYLNQEIIIMIYIP
jgi:succinate--hydroxymethylglutarate CoA-transferase